MQANVEMKKEHHKQWNEYEENKKKQNLNFYKIKKSTKFNAYSIFFLFFARLLFSFEKEKQKQ